MAKESNSDRTVILTVPYTHEEQLQTILYFLSPVLVEQRTENGSGGKVAYITVSA